jgi:putative phosphoesterase
MKIGLISDVHATPAPVQEALEIFVREGVETVLCGGDIAGYGRRLEPTVDLLVESGCLSVLGNHDQWWLEHSDTVPVGPVADYFRSLPKVVELSFEDRNIYMVHASPPQSLMNGIKLLDENSVLMPEQVDSWADALKGLKMDVLVVGHTHQVFAERLGDVLVVNPGSTRFNHTCAILTLPEMSVEFLPLGGRTPKLTWHLGGGWEQGL